MSRRFSVIVVALVLLRLLSAPPSPAIERSDWGTKDRVWKYVGQAETESDEASLDDIYAQAVKAAVGRFYFGEERFLARERLRKYLERYAEDFVASKKVLVRRQRGPRVFVQARVQIYADRLFNDLKAKRFVYRPRSNPQFYVYLKETVDGGQPPQPTARNIVQGMIDRQGLARFERQLPGPPPERNALEKDEWFEEARKQAQIHEVECLLVGAIDTKQVKTDKLYYKDETFYEAEIVLNLVRVDDGEVLFSTTKKTQVAHGDAAKARATAIETVTRQAAREALRYYLENWAKTIHWTAGHRIMLTDVSTTEMNDFVSLLETLDPSVRVYLRNYFGRVAVLNFEYTNDPKMLALFLRRAALSGYRLAQQNENRYELESVTR